MRTDPLFELQRFDPSVPIEEARTPPASWYSDAVIGRLEATRVFGRSWNAVARAEQVSSPGSFAAAGIGDDPIVVTRDHDGVLRAFANSCRHHATRVAEGAGRCDELVCPYHGWTYGLDGRLLRAPGVGAIRNFERGDLALPELSVAQATPLILVHPGSPRTPFDTWFAPVAARLGDGLADLVFAERRTYRLRCNWKVFVDNYLDGGYHVSHVHEDLAGQLDLTRYRTELLDEAAVQTCSGRDARIGDHAVYAWVYPNLMINRYGPILDVNVVTPVDAQTCEVVFDWYFDPAVAGDDAFVRENIVRSERVQQEDIAISEAVQEGLRSSFYDAGRYAPATEAGAHLFHRLLHRDLAATARSDRRTEPDLHATEDA